MGAFPRLRAVYPKVIKVIVAEAHSTVDRVLQLPRIGVFNSGYPSSGFIFPAQSMDKELLAEYQLKDEEVAYIGDDLFDLAVMKRVGFPATVADATEEAKSVSILISDFAGGKGAVRQIIEFILKAQEKWQAVIDSYLNIEDETDAKEVEKNISQ